MGATQIRIEGRALASGEQVGLTLSKRQGLVTFRAPGWPKASPLTELSVGAVGHTSFVSSSQGACVRTVEHLASALAGLRIYANLHIEFHNDALPLLDGGAKDFVDALDTLDLRPTESFLTIANAAEFQVGNATYRFIPSDETTIVVEFVTDHPWLATRATWDGRAGSYRETVASARTFMSQHDVDAYLAQGERVHVDPGSVFVIGEKLQGSGSVHEPVRHKLLDLLGDLYLYGGPPRGRLEVRCPGHAKTHEAMRLAHAHGVLGLQAAHATFGL